ncbi:MAG: hypothetical protein ACI3VR_03820 [Intestinibacter sp.]|uniref:hypothetical protein n=1 Tax=Intestinibacter sp. TaxID=1965304 RepID=UPI003F15277A
MGINKIKKFDELLFLIKPDQRPTSYIIWLLAVCFWLIISPVSEYKLGKIFFVGGLVFASVFTYIKSYLDKKESETEISIYKKLKYCPIDKKDIIKVRFSYLIKYLLIILVILSIINCFSCMYWYHCIKISSFLYILFIILAFGFLPISIDLILTR